MVQKLMPRKANQAPMTAVERAPTAMLVDVVCSPMVATSAITPQEPPTMAPRAIPKGKRRCSLPQWLSSDGVVAAASDAVSTSLSVGGGGCEIC